VVDFFPGFATYTYPDIRNYFK